MSDFSPDEAMLVHPGTEVIAAYLSNGLPLEHRSELEIHLAGCLPCRREVTSARRILRANARRGHRLLAGSIAAAAAVLLVAVLLRRSPGTLAVSNSLRDGRGLDAAPHLVAVAPADGDTLSATGLRFVWTRHEGQPLYHLTLTDAGGRAVWVRESMDTAVRLATEVELTPGRTYYWYVDAIDGGGSSLTTGTHRFTVHR